MRLEAVNIKNCFFLAIKLLSGFALKILQFCSFFGSFCSRPSGRFNLLKVKQLVQGDGLNISW